MHGNVRAPSKEILCDKILKSWEAVSNDIIEKSFLIVGQSQIVKPEDIECLKKIMSAL